MQLGAPSWEGQDAGDAAAGVPLAAAARTLTDETQFLSTNDGVPIAYDVFGKTGPVVVLIHGWSGSRHYFELNARVYPNLGSRVYAYGSYT